MKKRLISIPMLAILATVLPACSGKNTAVILYTNDVHCAIEQVISNEGKENETVDQMGYSSIASYKKEMMNEYGKNNVYLVDNGDHLQGAYQGSLSKGEDMVKAMNYANYDLATPGNHEFDFGMDTFLKYTKDVAKYEYISTNFVHNGENVFKPYRVAKLAGKKIAFLGATTPDTYTSSSPKYFRDDSGKYVYTFSEGDTRDGKALYEKIQKTVDEVRNNEKVDYVVLMAHLGVDETNSPYMSTEVIKNTTGIDVVLDGHSHSVITRDKVKNKNGDTVLLSSTGTKLKYVGKLLIDGKGNLTTELVHEYKKQDDADAKKEIDTLIKKSQDATAEVVAKTDFDLTIADATTGKRRVRQAETNMGDLVADAYQAADTRNNFAFINGGGVRATIKAGNITLKDVLSVQTFNNVYETYKTKGLNIRNALENSVRELPVRTEGGVDFATEANYGGYLQASKGIKFAVDTTIPSPVQKDSKNFFTGVSGKRRVHSIQVATTYNNDGEPTAWEALSDTKEYTFGCISYVVEENGDGHNEFKLGEDTTKVTEEYFLDYQIVSNYFTSFPKDGGVPKVPTKYQYAAGADRVTYSKNTSSN